MGGEGERGGVVYRGEGGDKEYTYRSRAFARSYIHILRGLHQQTKTSLHPKNIPHPTPKQADPTSILNNILTGVRFIHLSFPVFSAVLKFSLVAITGFRIKHFPYTPKKFPTQHPSKRLNISPYTAKRFHRRGGRGCGLGRRGEREAGL